ncbi:MAG: thiamine phosphate synthase, partial [Rhodothermia bacterium]
LPDLPRLLLIADGFCDPAIGDRILELVASGLIPWIQLRDHRVGSDVFGETAARVVDAIRGRESGSGRVDRTLISLNGHAELARELGVGVHVGFRGPAPEDARAILGRAGLVGYSAHEVSDVSANNLMNVDYFTISPIYEPISKPGMSAVGLGLLGRFAAACPKPVFALGGVTPDRIAGCIQSGAYGAAVIGGILEAGDPVSAVRAYLDATGRDTVPTKASRQTDGS